MPIDLDTPYLDDGIRSVNFFNGRLLTGEDLSQEQRARRRALELLGRAAGEGVAHGLEVTAAIGGSTATAPVVTVKSGLAVNRLGQPVSLPADVEVSLLTPASRKTAAGPEAGAFGACDGIPSVYVAGTGVYLFTIAPAYGTQGKARASGLGTAPSPCGAKHLVEGIQFRLLRLDVPDADLDDAARLRNRVAHACLGTNDAALQAFLANPFAPPPERYGLVDRLRDGRLGDCEVPLATIHWTAAAGIRWVDLWSVRRRISRVAFAEPLGPLVGERIAREREAMVWQFQDQIADVSFSARPGATARAAYSHLPPVGLLPLGTGTTPGFAAKTFLADVALPDPPVAVIERAKLTEVVAETLGYPPIATSAPQLVWLYEVRESRRGDGPPVVLFAHGSSAFAANARFDVGWWDHASFALM